MASSSGPEKKNMDPQTQFYRHFQESLAALREKIEQLDSLATVGGERQDAIEDVMAGISRLSSEVADASGFVVGYDQKIYAQAIRGLTESLNETTSRLAPRSRFQFKPRTEAQLDNVLAGNDTVGELPSQFRRGFVGGAGSGAAAASAIGSKNYNADLSRPAGPGIRKPSFSAAQSISIQDQMGIHIVLPASASRATSQGKLTNMARCVVDMSIPTSSDSSASPFATLTVTNIRRCLVVVGKVAGSAHITGVSNSVVVVEARQVRIHDCKDTDFYLYSSSQPIIEDCANVRFAPMPGCFGPRAKDAGVNLWDKVEDFKWLKSEPSPNWSIIPDGERIQSDVWTQKVPGGPGLSLDDVLKAVGIPVGRLS